MIPYRFRDSARRLSGVRAWLGGLKNNVLHGTNPPRQPLLRQIRMVPRINNRFVPDADAIVATAWPTAHSISRLSPRKGAKCYIVQHREIDSGLPEDVDATYRLPLFRIAGSEYTARLLREEVGVEAEAVVRNGIDVSFWSRGSLPRPARSGVLMPHAPGERKGARDGFAAFERVLSRPPTEQRNTTAGEVLSKPKSPLWEINALRAQWKDALDNGPRDQNGNRYGMPIEEAKKKLIEQGLPVRSQAADGRKP